MDFIRSQKMNGTFNPTSFAREYGSRWTTGSENAFFSADIFDRNRSLQEPIFEREVNLAKNCGYIFGIDVGRFSDTSEVSIWKYVPQKGTTSTKFLVNQFTFERMSFCEQAVEIKLLYEKYLPQAIVIDGNGVGAGLVDELIKSQVDVRTNQYLRPWGVKNDDKGYYTSFKTADMIPDLLYIVKANAQYNTDMYANYQVQLTTGKLRFLVDERQAKLKLDSSRAQKFKNMTEEEKTDWLMPFIQTSLLRDQLANLEEKREGTSIALDRMNKNIKKDKVSSSGMALFYIKTFIDDVALMNQSMDWMNLMSFNKSSGQNRRKPSLSFSGNRKYYSNLR